MQKERTELQKIGFLIFDGVYFTDIAVTRIVFEEANYVLSVQGKEKFYEILSVGEKDKYEVYKSTEEKTHLLSSSEAHDLNVLIIPGGKMDNVTNSENIKKYLETIFPKLDTLASVCGGAVALAHFGYLREKKAATHPLGRYEEIEAKYKSEQIKLLRETVVRDGKIITSGGVFKGVDLALAVVREDLGEDIARLVIEEIRYFGEGKF